MASVWKRLQRVNKRAAKFSYTASYHRIDLDTTPKWKPNKLSIVWTRRSRREVTDPHDWEPSLKDPLRGSVIFSPPTNKTVTVTLFRDARTNELEDKDWTFVLEDVSSTGRRRRLAGCAINMRQYASLEPSERTLVLPLTLHSKKVTAAAIHLTLHSVLLKEGHATDEDMQSLASLLSVNNNSDIAVLEDLDEDDTTIDEVSMQQMAAVRGQMEALTRSLSGSAATPDSVPSLALDSPPTPTPTPAHHQMDTPRWEPLHLETNSSTPIDKCDVFKPIAVKPRTVSTLKLKPLALPARLSSVVDSGVEDDDKTPTADTERPFPRQPDNTPVQELIEWCVSVTRDYPSVTVTDLTTSFRSGLAFCAILHHYRPDLIDFSGLQPDQAEANVRCALEASASLGISQVLSVGDVCGHTPDRLAIMTYLFQLRAHFTGSELQVEQLGGSECESSYLVGRHDTDDDMPRDLFAREVSARRSNRQTKPPTDIKAPLPSSPSPPLGVGRTLFTKALPHEKNKPTAKWFEPLPPRPDKLMTHKELTDPFASDEEDEGSPPTPRHPPQPLTPPPEHTPLPVTPAGDNPLSSNGDIAKPEPKTPEPLPDPLTPPPEPQTITQHIDNADKAADKQTDKRTDQPMSPELPKPTPQLLSRHDELKERARQLLEATKREAREKERAKRQSSKEKDDGKENGISNGDLSPKKGLNEQDRQTLLRERARRLIADARAGLISPTSPVSGGRARPALPTMEIISRSSVMEELAAAGGMEHLDALMNGDSPHSLSPDRSEGRNSEDNRSTKSAASEGKASPLHSFAALVDRLTPDHDDNEKEEGGSYIASELEALEREQRAVDARAAALEVRLRAVMAGLDSQEEAELMSQWFHLVNKKNALLRRQMQLNILEQEEDLTRRCSLLARELRLSLAVEEWRKTASQKRRERLLLQELVAAVNERDRLVQEMDEQERAIADDDEIERNLSQVDIQRKNNCILQ